MAFEEDITRHIEQIKTRLPHVKGEEGTKQALVVPLLQVLGYDVYDPREVQPEYISCRDDHERRSNEGLHGPSAAPVFWHLTIRSSDARHLAP